MEPAALLHYQPLKATLLEAMDSWFNLKLWLGSLSENLLRRLAEGVKVENAWAYDISDTCIILHALAKRGMRADLEDTQEIIRTARCLEVLAAFELGRRSENFDYNFYGENSWSYDEVEIFTDEYGEEVSERLPFLNVKVSRIPKRKRKRKRLTKQDIILEGGPIKPVAFIQKALGLEDFLQNLSPASLGIIVDGIKKIDDYHTQFSQDILDCAVFLLGKKGIEAVFDDDELMRTTYGFNILGNLESGRRESGEYELFFDDKDPWNLDTLTIVTRIPNLPNIEQFFKKLRVIVLSPGQALTGKA